MTAESESAIRSEICEFGRRMWERGFIAANDGNISVRLGEELLLATPTGVSKGFMTPDMIVKTDLRGETKNGEWRPSSELRMHVHILQRRSDVHAIVHAHPPVCTAFSVAGIAMEGCVLPEIVVSVGSVPLAEYATPASEEVVAVVDKLIGDHDAMLLAHHGAVTVGGSLTQAYFRMETLEHYAQILLAARQLGGERLLPPHEVAKLAEIRRVMGVSPAEPGCETCPVPPNYQPGSPELASTSDELASRIADIVVEVLKKYEG